MSNISHYEASKTTEIPQSLVGETPEERKTFGQINFSRWVGSESHASGERVWEDISETTVDLPIRRILDDEYFESCDFLPPLGYQEPFLEQGVTRRQTEPRLWSMSNEEWALIEPLLNKGGIESTTTGNRKKPRSVLNSLIFLLVNGGANIPLPNNPNFSKQRTVYNHFPTWQKSGAFEKVLTLLEKKAREPLRSYYRNLLKNFHEASNSKANRRSIRTLRLSSTKGLTFQGVTDEQWVLIEPLLSNKPDHRSTLNSIFSILINGASRSASPDLAEKSAVDEYLDLWERDGTLKNVLNRLIEGSEERLQSDYRKMLSHLQDRLTVQTAAQLQPTGNEECGLVTKSNLDHQKTSLELSLTRSETDPELWRLSNREWSLVKPLFTRKIKVKGTSRNILNSILFILIKGERFTLPKEPNFSVTVTAEKYFLLWQADKVFEKTLALLKEGAQEPLQSYCRKLLKNLQKISHLQATPISTRHFIEKFGSDGSEFRGVNNREWNLVKHLLAKKPTIKSANHRPTLNSIFSVVINGVPGEQIPITPDFSSSTKFYKSFAVWKEDRTLKKALTLLAKEAQGRVQSDYLRILNRLERNPSLHSMRMSAKQDRYPIIKISSAGEEMGGATHKPIKKIKSSFSLR